MTTDDAWNWALALPQVVEKEHHGIPSLRVCGKILATMPDGNHLRVMVDEGGIRAAVGGNPRSCREFWWGSRLACVVVEVAATPRDVVTDLLFEAWRRKAPRRLHAEVSDVTPPL